VDSRDFGPSVSFGEAMKTGSRHYWTSQLPNRELLYVAFSGILGSRVNQPRTCD
jgi:hypothetical protein